MIDRTAKQVYENEGPGIGSDADYSVLGKGRGGKPFCPIEGKNRRIIEIGFGKGFVLKELSARGHFVAGIDICPGSTHHYLKELDVWEVREGHAIPLVLDASHERIPFIEDFFDYAFCTETIEHLSNPYHMVSEVKRVLKHGGWFCLSYPHADETRGYGVGMHAVIYPEFLAEKNFERFMMQAYFARLNKEQNGGTVWYLYENVKELPNGKKPVSPFEVGKGNFDPVEIYPPEVRKGVEP